MPGTLLAIFVGGRSSRMGTDKGLLTAPGGSRSLLESLVWAGRKARLPLAFIGDASPYDAIAVDVPRVDDRPQGAGPLGGLAGAFHFAAADRHTRVIAVACDMPYVGEEVLRVLADHPSQAAVLAPRRGQDSPWEPMLARYDVAEVSPVLDETLRRGKRSFQTLFANTDVEALPLTHEVNRALDDWDLPSDVPK